MTTEKIVDLFHNLTQKIETLINEKRALKRQINILKTENAKLLTDINRKDLSSKDYKNQDKITKIVDNVNMSPEDSKQLRIMLDEYIKQLDQCIVHLDD